MSLLCLRQHREKIFGPAPSHPLDGNVKARVWAAAAAYNSANRQPRQYWGPLTRTTLDVLKTLLWRFHVPRRRRRRPVLPALRANRPGREVLS